jgi:hypothetical protein
MHARIGEKLAFMTCNICDGLKDDDRRDRKLEGKRHKNEVRTSMIQPLRGVEQVP